jgi:hypothetical protein
MVNQGDAAIARLRLFLADIEGKERQLQVVRRQFRDQMERVVGFALYHEASVDQTVSMMADVEERDQVIERTLGHLLRLRERVQAELESLMLTRGIEAAKAELADLESRRLEIEQRQRAGTVSPGDEAGSDQVALERLDAEMRRLQSLIHEATDQAVRSLSERRGRRRG